MKYIEQFEKDMFAKLQSSEVDAAVVRWASEKVLESYKNGIKAGQKGEVVARSGESRRRGQFGKAS